MSPSKAQLRAALLRSNTERVQAHRYWQRDGLTYRVMGVVDGYVVFRFVGAAPSLWHVNEFVAEFTPKGGEERRRAV